MAISFVGANAAAATSVSLPAHQAGDTIIVAAFRDGSITAPSLPAGFSNLEAGGANTCSMRVGWKRAASGAETSGTWTNATQIAVVVYRGASIISNNMSSLNGGTGTSVNYSAQSPFINPSGSSWVVGFGGHRTASDVESAPTGMINRTSIGAGPELAAHDTNGGVASWSAQNVTVNASSGWRTTVVELQEYVTAAGTLFTIAADGDDGYEFASAWTNNDTSLFQGEQGGVAQLGIRFAGVAIPQGSTINSASLVFTTDIDNTAGPYGTLHGAADDNLAQWSEGGIEPSNVSRTTASVSLTKANLPLGYDVAAIVQEIVNRLGWVSGNALAFAGDADAALNEIADVREFNTDALGTWAPRLYVDWTNPEPEPEPSAVAGMSGGGLGYPVLSERRRRKREHESQPEQRAAILLTRIDDEEEIIILMNAGLLH